MSDSDPTAFGRVDDDGVVWVRTAAGERSVGSYPGATPEEALAYFGRKFDELAGTVELLETRVHNGTVSGQEATTSVAKLRESIATASAVGDLDALGGRLDALGPVLAAARAHAEAAKAAAREAARATKERIVAEAETLAASTSWRTTGDRLRTLLEEWKAAPRLDRKSDDELWHRFSAARSAFDKSRRTHFATLESTRGQAKAAKVAIVTEAESLVASTEWASTAHRFRDLMTSWKAAGRAGRSDDDALWARFRAAQDQFFAARNADLAERDAGLRGNLERKQALLAEAEALLPVTDQRSARAALRGIQEQWEAVGHVPRDAKDAVEGRLRRVEEAVRDAESSSWQRSNPQARARAEDAVAQLRTTIATLEAKAEQARAAGDDRALRDAEESLTARRSWLAEAERTLAELAG